mmetsp:Transcript_31150/g.101982  ORF Transcript_31150/g.101982 Transcript_31150/m.101982 type:complete len:262 (+) Transcript_31150:2-787(+)
MAGGRRADGADGTPDADATTEVGASGEDDDEGGGAGPPLRAQSSGSMAVAATASYDGGDDAFPFGVDELCGAMHAAFVSADHEFLRHSANAAGTTAVVAMLADGYLVVGNAGDSRACLLREGAVLPLSLDHKPDRPDELARIQAAGGFVAGGRVMRALAVSRAIGDRDFKQLGLAQDNGLHFDGPLVVPDPEVRVVRVQEGDQLLLACDGLWDVVTAEAAFQFLAANGSAEAPQRALDLLTRSAEVDLSSNDNITAVYVRL